MITGVIDLLKLANGKNNRGTLVKTIESFRTVYCEEQTASQKEISEMGAIGLAPSRVFKLSDYLDYENEEFIRATDYLGQTQYFRVYRNMRKVNTREILLFCESLINPAEIGVF